MKPHTLVEKLKRKLLQRSLVATGALFAFFGIAAPLPARADVLDTIFELGVGAGVGVSFHLLSVMSFAVTWFISLIAGMFVAFLGWVLQVVLVINMNVVNSTVVQTGFPVMLSIANLFFVFGIIVIAIATILRIESYGIKKALMSLVMMAVLVNFGLVIAGVILNFSDSFTVYFVESIVPHPLEEVGTVIPGLPSPKGLKSLDTFASTITGAFQPQANFFWGAVQKTGATDIKGIASAFNIGSQNSQDLLAPIAGIILSVISLLIIIIVLGSFVVMLLYRYVKLSLLLVLLPLQWGAYALPGTKKYFAKWWDDFIKQAFFPPIVVFFLWLALKVAESMGEGATSDFAALYDDSSELSKGVTKMFTGFFASSLTNVVKMFILGSIMLAGLAAAHKFGSKFAETALKGVEGAKHFGVKQASALRNRAAAAAWQKTGMDKKAKAWEATPGSWLKPTGWVGAATSFLGRTLTKGSKPFTKTFVKEAGKDAESLGTLEKVNKLKGNLWIEDQLALIASLLKEGNAHLIQSVNGKSLAQFMEDEKESGFKRYGQGGIFLDLENKMGMSEGLRKALLNFEQAEGFAKEGDSDKLEEAQKQLTLRMQGLAAAKPPEILANFIMTKAGYKNSVDKGNVVLGLSEERTRDMVFGALSGVLKTTPTRARVAIQRMDTFEKDMMKDYIVEMAERDHEGSIEDFYKTLPPDTQEYLLDGQAAKALGLKMETLKAWKTKKRSDGRKGVGDWDVPPSPTGSTTLKDDTKKQESDPAEERATVQD